MALLEEELVGGSGFKGRDAAGNIADWGAGAGARTIGCAGEAADCGETCDGEDIGRILRSKIEPESASSLSMHLLHHLCA